jgi:hypothetical protein
MSNGGMPDAGMPPAPNVPVAPLAELPGALLPEAPGNAVNTPSFDAFSRV